MEYFTQKGYEIAAATVKSWTDEGNSFLNAIGRYAIAADLILSDHEQKRIYEEWLKQGGEDK